MSLSAGVQVAPGAKRVEGGDHPCDGARVHRILAALALYALLAPTPWTVIEHARFVTDQRIVARPVPLDAIDRTADRLMVMEAWELDSRHSRFGGYSALAISGPRRFVLASDTGWLTWATLGRGGRVTDSRIAPLPDPPSRLGSPRAGPDIEAMTRMGDGTFLLGFEHGGHVRRYDAALIRALAGRTPPEIARWPVNRGPEAMTRLSDGRVLVIAEDAPVAGGTAALLYPGDPTDPNARPLRFAYDAQGKGLPVDAATLPGGRVLILHRKVTLRGVESTIAIADVARIRGGRNWRSRALGTIRGPLAENYEGIALDPDAAEPTIWLVSDDNLLGMQRTLLLRVAIRLPRPR